MQTIETRMRKLQTFEYVGIPKKVRTTFSHVIFQQVKPERVYADHRAIAYIQTIEESPLRMLLRDPYRIKPLWFARFEERLILENQSKFLDMIDVYGFQIVDKESPDEVFQLPILTVARWQQQQTAYCAVLQALQAGYLLTFGMRPLYEQLLFLADIDRVSVENGMLFHTKTGQPLDVETLKEVFKND